MDAISASSDWVGLKAAAMRRLEEDDDERDHESAYDAAQAALKAVTGESQPQLFSKGGTTTASNSFSNSFSNVRLSESLGKLPQDEFLSKLAKAEAVGEDLMSRVVSA
jgi:hypothetical protein